MDFVLNFTDPLEAFVGFVIVFAYGLNVGSFLNVVIWRLPRGGSLAEPTWSYCPNCKHRLQLIDLVPVFSYVALGGRCRYCEKRISPRYPAIELLTALLFVAVMAKSQWSSDTFFSIHFVALLICVFFIDLEHFIIPEGLNLLAVLIGFARNAWLISVGAPDQWDQWGAVHLPRSLAGMLGYAGVIYGIGLVSYIALVGLSGPKRGFLRSAWRYISETVQDWVYLAAYYLSRAVPPLRRYVQKPEPMHGYTADEIEADEDGGGMGGGDGLLAAAIGANLYAFCPLGPNYHLPLWGASLGFAILTGAVAGLGVLIAKRRSIGSRTAIPFGPFMTIGALIALFYGQEIVAGYVAHFLNFPGSPFASGVQK